MPVCDIKTTHLTLVINQKVHSEQPIHRPTNEQLNWKLSGRQKKEEISCIQKYENEDGYLGSRISSSEND